MENNNPTLILQSRVGIKVKWLNDNKIISQDAIRARIVRGTIVQLQKACRGKEAYIDFGSLDEELKNKIQEALNASPYESARNTVSLAEFVRPNASVGAYYDSYKTAKGSFLPLDKRIEYTANAIVLSGIREMREAYKRNDISLPWTTIVRLVSELDRSEWKVNLPENERKLKQRYEEYERGGLEALVHKNFKTGSTNAAKVLTAEQVDMMVMIIAEHRNFSNKECADFYNIVAEAKGWKAITASAVADWRKKNEYMITARRKGRNAHNNVHAMTIQRERPSAPLLMWVLDGWDCELYYQKTVNNRTTYHNRVTVEVVLDPSTRYPIGYAIGETENAELITRALRNAIRHTQELFGRMLRPNQIQCDNFAISAMRDVYNGLAVQAVTPAGVGNAKSKDIEPWFREFNDKYCKKMFNWSGHGVKAKSQPNIEITMANKKNFPTLEELIYQIEMLISQYRKDHLAAFTEKYKALPEERKVELPMMKYLGLFGETRRDTYRLGAQGIVMKIDGERIQYDCFDERFRDLCYTDWHIKYDPQDMSSVLATNAEGTEQFLLQTKYIQPMALADRQPGDYEKLAEVLNFRKKESERISNALGAHQEGAMQILQDRELEDLSKFLITDSQGQHKLPRYAAERGLPAVQDVIPQPVVETEENIRNMY